MRRSLACLLALSTLAVVGGCRQSGNIPDPALVADGRARIDTAAITMTLDSLEREYSRVGFTNDVEGVMRIEADDYRFTSENGSVSGKARDVGDAKRRAEAVKSWSLSDVSIVPVSSDAAVSMGKFVVRGATYRNPQNGKLEDWSGDYRYMNVWVRRDNRWQILISQITKVVKPAA